jgi:glycosyltransferase involved in cell wall biosynthesis
MDVVVREVDGVRLTLVGDGPERHRIEKMIQRLGLNRHIMLTGFRSDISNLLRCSDALVLCSETESAPLTLLEGLSSGLPCIATAVGGIPEIIQNGENGLLVQPKNPMELSKRILELNSDRVLRRRLGENARKTVMERYTAEKIVKRYIDLYEKVGSI